MTFLSVQYPAETDGSAKIYALATIMNKDSATDEKPRLSISIRKIGLEEKTVTKLASIDEAEKIVLNYDFESRDTFDPSNNLQDYPLLSRTAQYLLVLLNRAANRIAVCTRRGFGNVVVYNPDNAKWIDLIKQEATNLNFRFVEHADCPKDRFVILYVNANQPFDSGFIFANVGNENFLYSLDFGSEAPVAKDYGQIVWIK